MTWTADQCYLAGLDYFTTCVNALGADDWKRPSPCEGWTALDVLGHVGGATRFGTQVLTGQPVVMPLTENPASAVDGDPVAWWNDLAGPGRAAMGGVDLGQVLDTPMGPRSIAEGLRFPAIDLFVHGWDLARSAGQSVELPVEAITFARESLGGFPESMMRNPRIFADALEAGPAASPTEAFIAWTGRDPGWASPSA